MRFFTRTLVTGAVDDTGVDRVSSAYQQHLTTLLASAPEGIVALAQTHLHDGRIRRVVVDHVTHILSIGLRCGDLQVGYFDVDLQYHEVHLTAQQLQILSRRTNDRQTEILADEIDIEADGRFVHRLLFWPDDEVELAYTAITITKQRQSNRDISCEQPVYIEIENASDFDDG